MSARSSRSWWSILLAALALALVYSAWGARQAWSADLPHVVQVEEDWELVISDPDAGNAAPQVTCTISPHSHLNNLHAVIEFNHKTVPYYSTGGVHLQTWAGEYNLQRRSHGSNSSLATRDETITWTTRMHVASCALTFSVVNGNSTTWGGFGSGTSLQASYGTSLWNLNNYSPEQSVQNSGVGFASNRVSSLVLKRVRYTLSNGQVITDDAPRVVHGQ